MGMAFVASCAAAGDEHVDRLAHELEGQRFQSLFSVFRVADVEADLPPFDVAQLLQPLAQGVQHGRTGGQGVREEHADPDRARRDLSGGRCREAQDTGGGNQAGDAHCLQRTHWPSRPTTRPRLTTQARVGRATTNSAKVSPGTMTKLAVHPTSRP